MTNAERQHRNRQHRYTASGRQIACVIRDPVALANLARLEARRGTTAAVTLALRCADSAWLEGLDTETQARRGVQPESTCKTVENQ